MKKRNKHMGSSLEDFLKEEGILARRTNTSRAFDLLLYPGNALNCNPLSFIKRNLILSPVVELGCPRALVVCDMLRGFQGAVVLQVSHEDNY